MSSLDFFSYSGTTITDTSASIISYSSTSTPEFWVTAVNDNSKFYRISRPGGSVIGTSPRPSFSCMAACWDGTYFYLTEKGGSKIHKINPSTGAEITTFSFSDTGQFLLGLTYFASTGYLYGNWNNEIRKIDKETGKVVSKGTITNFSTYNAFVGITNDGTYFWLLDMNSNNQDGRLHKFTITE